VIPTCLVLGVLRGFAVRQRRYALDFAALFGRGTEAHGEGVWRFRARVLLAYSAGTPGDDQENST
jgi:hypothetical protein